MLQKLIRALKYDKLREKNGNFFPFIVFKSLNKSLNFSVKTSSIYQATSTAVPTGTSKVHFYFRTESNMPVLSKANLRN